MCRYQSIVEVMTVCEGGKDALRRLHLPPPMSWVTSTTFYMIDRNLKCGGWRHISASYGVRSIGSGGWYDIWRHQWRKAYGGMLPIMAYERQQRGVWRQKA